MKLLVNIIVIVLYMNPMILFDFEKNVSIDAWRVVNDGVMGGLSEGQFSINEAGHGYFRGKVSLANNGGFSSVRYRFKTVPTSEYTRVNIRLKGDGKGYQFRVKAKIDQQFSYIKDFETSGDWETITVEFSEMYAAFRGRILDIPNFSGEEMTEIAFLIGNKKEETFALEIDSIALE